MLDGFVKAAAVTPKIRVADCVYNARQICREMELAEANGAKIIVFPELCLTGYTCSDLFWQELLLSEAKKGLHQILAFSAKERMLWYLWGFLGKRMENSTMWRLPSATDGSLVWCQRDSFPIILNFMRQDILHREMKSRKWQSLKASRCLLEASLLLQLPGDQRPYRRCGNLRRSVGTGASKHRTCPGRCDCDCQPVRQR